jgi:hypothetical protein
MNRDQQVTAIAEAFAEVMRQWLSPAEFAEMKRRNESGGIYASGACASHDFCDSNMAMAEAFKGVTGHDVNGDDETDATIWGDAWSLARKLYLGSP